MREKRIAVWVQKFKDRESPVLQWFDPDTGARRSKSSGATNEQDIERARADLEYELNHGQHQHASKLQWSRFRTMFEDEFVAGKRDRTQEKYKTVFDVFEMIINPDRLRTINERTLSAFVKGMRERKKKNGKIGLAPHTIRGYLRSIRTAIAWAVEQKLMPQMPRFPAVKVPKLKPQPIPAESWERLLGKAPDDGWKAFLMCGWWAGLRLLEAYRLRWEQSDRLPWIDFEGNRIVLPAAFAKADADQWVPMHPVLRQTLAALPRTNAANVFRFTSRKGNKPLSRCGVTNRVLLFAKQAGVKLSMHRLRKGFGCRIAQQLGKGNAPILHTLMRHSSMQITMDYYANVDSSLQQAIGELQ